MAQDGGLDLRTLLEQDRVAVLELIDLARKLIVETRTSHFWTEVGVQHCDQLAHIAANVAKMLEALEPHWGEGKRVFNRPEGAKLWKTAAGMLGALPPLRARFAEQMDKRRRQRIMGQSYEETAELSDAEIEQSLIDFVEHAVAARRAWEELSFEPIPAQLQPILKVDTPSANGVKADVRDGVSADEIASEKEPAAAPEEPAQ